MEAVEPPRGADPQSGQVHLGRGQDVRRGAGGGRETEEAAAVAGAPAFTAITVDGCLQLSGTGRANYSLFVYRPGTGKYIGSSRFTSVAASSMKNNTTQSEARYTET